MEILGLIIFPDTSGDSVLAMYLQFLENLEQPTQYNWGGAASYGLGHVYPLVIQ
jgi:hypothetical protein